MKIIMQLLSLAILILSCNPQEKPQQNLISKELQGAWGMTSYLDSILINKEIEKSSRQGPAWFGILMEIKNDSIFSYGSLKSVRGKLLNTQDTIFKFSRTEYGKWMLLKNDNKLILKQFANQEYPDSTIYEYKRKSDLLYMINGLNKNYKYSSQLPKLEKHLEKYFNKNILSGKYRLLKTNKEVILYPDGKLEGLHEFSHYNIGVYFGTYHPFQDNGKYIDNVWFENKETKKTTYFNWKFQDDLLILQEFYRDSTEHFELGERIIKLEKVDD